jgi:two-component system, chemotaxis family, chemotaxis protein CheY
MPRCGTVLLIDDDVDLCESTMALLESDGYDVVGVNSGRDALELLRTGTVRPQLIIVDLMMPDMDGWMFRAESLCDANLASIPVIVLSAATRPVVAAAAAALRAIAGIVKPVDGAELLRLIGVHCRAAAT